MREHLKFAQRFVKGAVEERRRERACPLKPAPHRPDPASWPAEGITAAWLGHASVLLRLDGLWIATDPVLEPRIGFGLGVGKLGPRRLVAPALTAPELPALDAVLLSHAHLDHTDLGTLRSLPRTVPVVVQRGNSDLVRRFRNVTELDWAETATVAGIAIEALPARHWGARRITDRHRGYGGYLLTHGDHTVLFAGDTAYTDVIAQAVKGRKIDVAIMPIGAYDPWIDNHASPEEAWRMFRDIGAKYFLPVHYATFRLSREPADEPIARLLAAAGSERWRVALTEIGETWRLPPEPA